MAVSGSLGELLPYLKGREPSCPHVALQSQLLVWRVGLFIFSPFLAFAVCSMSSLCWVNVENVLVCFAVCKWLL